MNLEKYHRLMGKSEYEKPSEIAPKYRYNDNPPGYNKPEFNPPEAESDFDKEIKRIRKDLFGLKLNPTGLGPWGFTALIFYHQHSHLSPIVSNARS